MNRLTKVLTATVVALAFALAPVGQAGPYVDGGPIALRANEAARDGGRVDARTPPVRGSAPLLRRDLLVLRTPLVMKP